MNVKELIENFCEENDLELLPDYSGRSMYGKRCYGIVVGSDALLVLVKLCDYLRDNGVDSLTDVLGEPKTDSMGLSRLIYFPKVVN